MIATESPVESPFITSWDVSLDKLLKPCLKDKDSSTPEGVSIRGWAFLALHGCFKSPLESFSIFDYERLEDYLTPQQRFKAVAEILSTITLRVARKKKNAQTSDECQQ